MTSTVHSAVTELPHGLVLVDPSGLVGHDTPHGPTVTPLISTVSRHAEAISWADLTMQPGGAALAHQHSRCDIIIRLVRGAARTVYGPDMTEAVDMRMPEDPALPGPTLFVPRGIPHAAINLSTTEPVVAFEVRGTSDFDADVDLRADLEHRMHAAVAVLRENLSPA
ncbi:MAG: hypothetical protein ACRCY8_01870 [Dermatophilaceae bacterium]